MKKITLILFTLALAVTSVFGTKHINITANGTYPNPGPDGVNSYWTVEEGKWYSFDFKGSFVTASINLQEASVNESGVEEWLPITTKSAITAIENFRFMAMGNKVRLVVTLETTDDIDVLGPVAEKD